MSVSGAEFARRSPLRLLRYVNHITTGEIAMKRSVVLALPAWILLATAVLAGRARTVATAHGTVDKADADTLVLKPRTTDGKFAKHLTLKLTGTSKIASVSQEKRAGKLVFVQREISVKDIESNQSIAVIYGVHGKET